MILQFNRGSGGIIQPGYQWISWIHVEDVGGMIVFALENDSVNWPSESDRTESAEVF